MQLLSYTLRLVGYPQPAELVTPVAEWHKLTYLVLTPVKQS